MSVEVVGARPSGHASVACGSSSKTSAALASVDLAFGGDRDQRDAEALGVFDEIAQFGGFARPGERHDRVVAGDHAEIAVARLARMHEIGGRSGRGEGGRDLAADMAALAHAGDDHAAARGADLFHRARRRPRPRPLLMAADSAASPAASVSSVRSAERTRSEEIPKSAALRPLAPAMNEPSLSLKGGFPSTAKGGGDPGGGTRVR